MTTQAQRRDNDRGMAIFGGPILVAIDFSDISRTALAAAVSLADRYGAELHVLHVLETIAGAEALALNPRMLTDAERTLEREARDELRTVVAGDARERLQLHLAIEWGTPGIEILRYASEHDVTLIAIGTHGRGGVRDLVLGSVAESVVPRAPCTVLTIGR